MGGEGIAEVVPGIRALWLKRQRLPIGGDRIVKTPERLEGIAEIGADLRLIGQKPRGVAISGDCFLKAGPAVQGACEIVMDCAIGGLDAECLAISGDGPIEASPELKRDPQMRLRCWQQGIEVDHFAIRLRGLFRPAEIEQEPPEVQMSVNGTWLEAESFTIRSHGIVGPPGGVQSVAEIGVRLCMIGLDRDRTANQFRSQRGPLRFGEQNSEQMQSSRMMWLPVEHAAIDRFGFRQTPCAMKLQRAFEIGDGHGSAKFWIAGNFQSRRTGLNSQLSRGSRSLPSLRSQISSVASPIAST